ncbi:HAMP domain-containing histidine kinase [Halieaceae bacterium IMCC14734]|uniref:histidine kinase n=1 Tax=Candidatus Litorirhabdus singularis TaxID=2518993 RepID=A0ABT3TAQ2_9GAMM|nr:HAMP domain-containing histidine kinase [Candidatus Litorirhabdus singularis]
MNKSLTTTYSASHSNLRSLLIIRSLVLLCQSALLFFLAGQDISGSAHSGMLLITVALAVITLLSFWRLRRDWPVGDQEYFAQLTLDAVGLTAFLYLSGGANNPFVSYYLVPLVIAAAILPRTYTWLLAVISVGAYSALLYFYLPLPLFSPHAHGAVGLFNVHIAGMWIMFMLSVGLITYFVVGMAATLRRQEQATVEQREDQLRNEQILGVASLAAGTAHELATPLATMSVLLEELMETAATVTDQSDYQVLQDQVQRCKGILDRLSQTARMTEAGELQTVSADQYLQQTYEQWLVQRPEVTARLSAYSSGPAPPLRVDPTLSQAIENLLNNAANANPCDIQIEIRWDEQKVSIAILDHGPGIPADIINQLGRPVVSATGSGLGLGLLLSHATVNRYGGSIELRNRTTRGTCATLTLPVPEHD